ncbi:hypothetical protein KIS1582_0370 [Cytobacillus firmus]|uniref:Uncharacterized protein n=1 Tax=Cytobacillus firmus TaxID=1399 RepID=A0A800NFJ2_CYTFI|nr:hypothetical protein KIS1582_0370 [Cytobacillus firmus]
MRLFNETEGDRSMNSIKDQVEHVLHKGENIIECLTCSLVAHY